MIYLFHLFIKIHQPDKKHTHRECSETGRK